MAVQEGYDEADLTFIEQSDWDKVQADYFSLTMRKPGADKYTTIQHAKDNNYLFKEKALGTYLLRAGYGYQVAPDVASEVEPWFYCYYVIDVVKKTVPAVSVSVLRQDDYDGTVDLEYSVKDEGSDVKTLTVCEFESPRVCDHLKTETDPEMNTLYKLGAQSVSVSNSKRFRVSAVDSFGNVDSEIVEVAATVERDHNSEVSVNLYHPDGTELDYTAFYKDSVTVNAKVTISDPDSQSYNWPKAAELITGGTSKTLGAGKIKIGSSLKQYDCNFPSSSVTCVSTGLKIQESKTLKAEAGGGTASRTIKIAKRPVISGLRLDKVYAFQGEQVQVDFRLADRVLNISDLKVCVVTRSSQTLEHCPQSDLTLSPLCDKNIVQGGEVMTCRATFEAPASNAAGYQVYVSLSDSDITDWYATSKLDFIVVPFAGIMIKTLSNNIEHPFARNSTQTIKVGVGRLSASSARLQKIALLFNDTEVATKQLNCESILPQASDQQQMTEFSVDWPIDSVLPEQIDLKAKAWDCAPEPNTVTTATSKPFYIAPVVLEVPQVDSVSSDGEYVKVKLKRIEHAASYEVLQNGNNKKATISASALNLEARFEPGAGYAFTYCAKAFGTGSVEPVTGTGEHCKSLLHNYPAPTFKAISTNQFNAYTLSWSDRKGNETFHLLRRKKSESQWGEWREIVSQSAVSFAVNDLEQGVYEYKVRACFSVTGAQESLCAESNSKEIRHMQAAPSSARVGFNCTSCPITINGLYFSKQAKVELKPNKNGGVWRSLNQPIIVCKETSCEIKASISGELLQSYYNGNEGLLVRISNFPPNSSQNTLTVSVNDGELPIPAVPNVTVEDIGDGQLQLTVAPGTDDVDVVSYNIFENGADQVLVSISHSADSLTTNISKTHDHHGHDYSYCAQAVNKFGKVSSIGDKEQCSGVTLHYPDPAPGVVLFEDMNRIQLKPYKLKLKVPSDGLKNKKYQIQYFDRRAFRAEWQDLMPLTDSTQFEISAPRLGVMDYRARTCNRHNICTDGANITIEHPKVIISSVEINGSCGSSCVRIRGLNFSNPSTVSMQHNVTAVPFEHGEDKGIHTVRYISDRELHVDVGDEVIKAYTNGGIVVSVANGIKIGASRPYLADNTHQDDNDHKFTSPVYSASGVLYAAYDNKLCAHDQYGFAEWCRSAGAKISAKAVLSYDSADRDVIMVGAHDNFVYAWNHQGEQIWKTETRAPISAEGLVVGRPFNNADLFVGALDGALYSMTAETGQVNYLYKLGTGIEDKPFLVGNSEIWVKTKDGNITIIDRNEAGPGALKWSDLQSSPLLNAFNLVQAAGWAPSSRQPHLHSLLRLGYVILGRDLSREELSFLAYALTNNVTLIEIANAMLDTAEGLSRLPESSTTDTFYRSVSEFLYQENQDFLAGKPRQKWLSELNTHLTRGEFIVNVVSELNAAARFHQVTSSTLYYYYGFCHLHNRCEEPVDSDGDGISDEAERILKSSPIDPRDGLLEAPALSGRAIGGDIVFSMSYGRDITVFELSDFASNTGPITINATGKTAEHSLVRRNGSHTFNVRACLDIELSAGQVERACSAPSADETVVVNDSLLEVPVNPIAASVTRAGYSVPTTEQLQAHESYAVTPGSFRVNEQGASTYSVPISLPEGVAGVTPEVALNYNSQLPETMVATGWSLSAGSEISRCRQTQAQDGQFKAINPFDQGSDRYCLDGQRLIMTSGETSDQYDGVVGSTYRTEIDSQLRVTIEEGVEPYTKQFVVQGKDGSKRIYGGTKNSQAGGKVTPSRWLLRKSMDSVAANRTLDSSNVVHYEYMHNTQESDIPGQLEVVLSKISYSNNEVRFGYQAGPARRNNYSIEANSVASVERAQLTAIDVYNHNKSQLRHYDLDFSLAQNGTRQLMSVRECTDDSAQTCKRPVTFTYNDSPGGQRFVSYTEVASGSRIVATTLMDLDGNGLPSTVVLKRNHNSNGSHALCVIEYSTGELCQDIATDNSSDHVQIQPFDPDGDGTQSLLINTRAHDSALGSAVWRVFDYDSLNSQWSYRTINGMNGARKVRAADINGDGFDDFIYLSRYGSTGSGGGGGIQPNTAEPSAMSTAPLQLWVRYNNSASLLMAQSREVDVAMGFQYPQQLDANTPWYLADVNFDGLADIVTSACPTSGCEQQGKWDTIYVLYNEIDASTGEQGFTVGGSQRVTHSALQLIDINQDGLSDFLYKNEDNKWTVAVVRPSSFSGLRFDGAPQVLPKPQHGSISGDSFHVSPIIGDVDQNGISELYVVGTEMDRHQKYALYRYEWQPESQTLTHSNSSTDIFSLDFVPRFQAYGYFSDYDLDGAADLILAEPGQIRAFHQTTRSAFPGLLSTVTQGFGTKTKVQYGRMTDPSLYTKGEPERTRALEQQSGQRIIDLIGPSVLVERVETEAEDTRSNVGDHTISVRYKYAGARMQFGGRGMLGFESLTTSTYKGGHTFKTTTEYQQAFPYIGMPERTTKTMHSSSGSYLLSKARNQYAKISTPAANGLRYYAIYNGTARECSARVDAQYNGDISYGVAGYTCSETDMEQDKYGNVLNSTTSTYNSADAEAFVSSGPASKSVQSKHIVNQYYTGLALQLGRLKSTEVTTRRNESEQGKIVRNSAFTYYTSGEHIGLLKEEVVAPEGGCDAYLKTTYSYNSWGSITEKSTGGKKCSNSDDEPQTRTTKTKYTIDGRYATSTQNSLFTVQTVLSRNKFGQVTRSQNTDDVITTSYYDAYGQQVGQHQGSGSQQSTLMQHCPSDAPLQCFVMQEKRVNAELLSRTYLDKYGRTLASERLSPAGIWLRATSEYDKFGRVVEVKPAGLEAQLSTYDAFDRIVYSQDTQSNLNTFVSFDGLATTTLVNGDIAGGNQSKTVTRNALAEVVSVTDSNGQTLTYTHNATGQLLKVRSSADGGSELILNTYDPVTGRKTKTEDKDRGTWSYTYTPFGELQTQTDANGVVSTFSYDELGRKVGLSTSKGETASWHYDDQKPHRLDREESGNWSRHYVYDALGRGVASVTDLTGASQCANKVTYSSSTSDIRFTDGSLANPVESGCVMQLTQFDQYGRVWQQFDDYRRSTSGQWVEARGQRLVYMAGQVTEKYEAREGQNGKRYYALGQQDSAGRTTSYFKGHFSMQLGYAQNGSLKTLGTGGVHSHIQQHTYTFDGMGNLTSRQLTGENEATKFEYDKLNRVTSVNGSLHYQYDDNGNLTHKDGWTQVYGQDGDPLHALSERSKGTQTETFSYDANGNETSATIYLHSVGTTRDITYSGRNKATRIKVGNATTDFAYDANNQRFKRTEGSKTIFYVGNLELVKDTSQPEAEKYLIRRSINGDAVQTYYPGGKASLQWLFTDHQGSVVAIVNGDGKFLKRYRYDVFGKQSEIVREPDNVTDTLYWAEETGLLLHEVPANMRSYTGHEPVTFGGDNRIIHMNGRIYDADTGRFMQADPFIQAPSNLQNYNAYSYVLNNPLSYTDPSGYLFSALKNVNKKLKPFTSLIVGVGLIYITGGAASWFASSWYGAATAGAISGAAGAAANGGNILKGALTGAASAAAFYGVGTAFGKVEFGSMLHAGKIAAHGLVGGVMAELQGGNFGHGFVAAGVTQAFAPGIDAIDAGSSFSIARVVVSAIVGGTASKLSGGKFANGAVTGGFSRMFNDEMHQQKKEISFAKKMRQHALRIVSNYLAPKTYKLGFSATVPSSVLDFIGADSGGYDVGFEFGIVAATGAGENDLGLYLTRNASSSLSVPFAGQNERPFGRAGAFINLGNQEGTMRDFAGEASFASAGIGPLMLEGSLSDSGKYGFNTNFGAGYSMSGGRSTTSVLSLRYGLLSSGCGSDELVC
ncbi:RHS repeat-associated core domain-containing protein [Pseudoalteromonas ardens]|uniref:RHS repeat-associated core domain-containing protein n=1 Tax=Pseudoalteromonas ardens TaxID=3048490 RepID=UPI0024C38D67|nr:RHS repeat-associated core domain-containing protein [Pseudoalteromonas sp. R96]MDK1312760.1 RHS repeat-associated core domain-containing protein [Pseudoalteromonas sp. R96]